MPVIVVGGSGRGVGKTALVCSLIASMPEMQWTAIKITTHDHSKSMPAWEETEQSAKQHPDTDTARYLAAGAVQAFLVMQSGSTKLPTSILENPANLILESNQVLEFIQPDLCLMVENCESSAQLKPSYTRAVQYADAIVVYTEENAQIARRPSLPKEAKPVFRLTRRLLASGDILPAEMLAWINTVLHPASL